jgi:hypothetical protein
MIRKQFPPNLLRKLVPMHPFQFGALSPAERAQRLNDDPEAAKQGNKRKKTRAKAASKPDRLNEYELHSFDSLPFRLSLPPFPSRFPRIK